jgi:SAM-dependent methyltransferase
MPSTPDYLLGHDDREWSRLHEQHLLWAPTLLPTLAAAGLTPGARVLEVGCGSGELLGDLADVAETHGATHGLERDSRAAEFAARRFAGRADVTVTQGDLMTFAPAEQFDLIVARWVFCFLPDPTSAIARLASWLAPGGRLVIQDYNHDGIRLFPDRPAVVRCIEGFRAAWKAAGLDLWIGPRLPGLLRAARLDDVQITPHVKAGPPGSDPWRWVERFLHEHIDTIVDEGHLTTEEREAFQQAWDAAAADHVSVLFTPIQVTVSAGRAKEVGSTPRGRRP